jgi:predicted transcriptional regulator of viral defense system
LKPGLYNLVPFELGRATHYVGDPHLIAREAVGDAPYFLSHATAFELHRMATQPSLTIFVSSPRRFRPQTIGGHRYRFVWVPQPKFFGAMQYWVTKEQAVAISDIERTVLDGLRHPQYTGGITEVAKGLWMKRDKLNVGRLIEYATRLHVGAVLCRVGFLLERFALADEATLKPLRARLPSTYHRLDPLLPAEGSRLARWRLQLNVPPEELDVVRFG